MLVVGPPDRIALCREALKKIDVGTSDQQTVVKGPPEFHTYTVPSGTAEAFSRAIYDMYRTSPIVRVSVITSNSLLIYGTPQDHLDIAAQLGKTTPPLSPNTTAVIRLRNLEPADTATKLIAMYGDVAKTPGVPYISTDLDSNAIVVKGTSEQVGEVRAVIIILAGGVAPATAASAGASNMRILNLDKGSGSAMADLIEQMLREKGWSVRNLTPKQGEEEKKQPPKPEAPKPDAPKPDAPKPERPDARRIDVLGLGVGGGGEQQPADPQQNKSPNKPG